MSDTDKTDVKTDVTMEEKLRVAEEMLSAQKAQMEALQEQAKAFQAAKKAELDALIKAAPEPVRNRYTGKELDPLKDAETVKADVQQYQAMEEAAKKAALEHVQAYREQLRQKHGIALPDPEKYIVETPKEDPKSAEKPAQQAAVASQQSDRQMKMTDLAAKETLSLHDVQNVTGRFSAMAAFLQARKNAALGG